MRREVDWSRVAAIYDSQLVLERAAVRAVLDLLDLAREDELLDVGTGTGAVLRGLASRRTRPQRVVGLDQSKAMLARVPPLGMGWTLVEGDATALPFDDGSFDVVVATYLLHVLDETARERAVKEARRVLRGGGRLATVTPSWPRGMLAKRLYAPIVGVATRSDGWLASVRPLDPRPLLVANGFQITGSRCVARGYPSLCVVGVTDLSSDDGCGGSERGNHGSSSSLRSRPLGRGDLDA